MKTSYIASAFSTSVDKGTLVNLSANKGNSGTYRARSGTGRKDSATPSYLIGETAPQRRVPLSRLYLASFIVLLLAVGILFLLLSVKGQWLQNSRQSTQLAKRPIPVKTLPRVQLPTILKQTKTDPAFTKEHPGWTRQQTDALEFRLFRKGESLRAVQVICLNGATVTDEFFHSFVRELSGEDPPLLIKTGEINGFDLESGTKSNGFEFQVYRQIGSNGIRAFVVVLP
jgi:hypothetical protein